MLYQVVDKLLHQIPHLNLISKMSSPSPDINPSGIQPSEIASPEALISRIISPADAVFDRFGQPREAGKRFGACGFSSDLVRRSAEKTAVTCDNRQLISLHEALGATVGSATFQHAINILQTDGGPYLIDISFCQFVQPETGDIEQGTDLRSGNIKDHPLGRELIEKGFLPLTDETLQEYLRMTTKTPDADYIKSASVEKLLNNPSSVIGYDHDIEELDKYLEGKTV